MKLRRTASAALGALALSALSAAMTLAMPSPALAAINASQLGAAYDAGKTSVNFRIYSSRATRIELYLYSPITRPGPRVRPPASSATWTRPATASTPTSY